MKKQILNILALSIIIILFQSQWSYAQTIFQPDEVSSELKISGTSSLHDWEMDIEKFDCAVSVQSDDAKNIAIQSVDFKCQVEALKSHNKIMDNKAHDAFNPNKYPEITFVTKSPIKKVDETSSTVDGELSIAGTKKQVTLTFSMVSKNETQFKILGNFPLKMSDFGMEAPTAMMGTLKTGDEIVIHYEILFQNAQLGSLTN